MSFIYLLEADVQYCWFQQDGSTAHAADSTLQMLGDFCGGRIISRKFWPPRSPDLSPQVLYF
jgi:hypothetical protein